MFRGLTGSVEQHPVLADCYRALKRYAAVAELWEELREASPGGRPGHRRADRGRRRAGRPGRHQGRDPTAGAGAGPALRGAATHHARLWYALADLYERAGDAPKARELFGRVVGAEPGLADAAERLAALG